MAVAGHNDPAAGGLRQPLGQEISQGKTAYLGRWGKREGGPSKGKESALQVKNVRKWVLAGVLAGLFGGSIAVDQVQSRSVQAALVLQPARSVETVVDHSSAGLNVYTEQKGQLVFSGRHLAAGTTWQVFGHTTIQETRYANLGGTQWVEAKYLRPQQPQLKRDRRLIQIHYVPGYGVNLWRLTATGQLVGTGRRLRHGTRWRSLGTAQINGQTFYNLGGNQWIAHQYGWITNLDGQGRIGRPTYLKGVLLVNKLNGIGQRFGGSNPTANAALWKLQQAARAAGHAMPRISGYRSYGYQVKLYRDYVATDGIAAADQYSARPGFSEHQTGLAFDIGTTDLEASYGKTAAGRWLAQNCATYGFIIRFPQGKEGLTGYTYEPWHVRYVGVAAAQQIKAQGLSLEEYLGAESAQN